MMLAKEGIPFESVRREATGEGPAPFELIGLGRIDAYIATSGTVQQLRLHAKRFVAWSVDTVAPAPAQVYISTRQALDDRPELFANFLLGVYDALGALTAARDLKPIIASMNQKYDIVERNSPDGGEATLAVAIDEYRPAYHDKFASNASDWKSASELMVRAGIVEAKEGLTFYTDAIRARAFDLK